MARYFLDTGVLIGLTFLHDAWRDEAERIFNSDNVFYVNRIVIYEYCNSTRNNSRENTSVDWETENGVFGKKFSQVRLAQFNLEARLESLTEDELDLNTLVEAFLEEAGVYEDTTEDLIEEYIRPRIREFFLEVTDGRPITRSVAMEAMMTLCDEAETSAREKRNQIRERVRERNVNPSDREPYIDQLGFINGRGDTDILASVAHLQDANVLEKIISTDRSHMYENRERIKATVGVTVVFIKDEVAEPSEL